MNAPDVVPPPLNPPFLLEPEEDLLFLIVDELLLGADFAFETPSLKPLLKDDLSFLVSVIVFSIPALTPLDLSFSFI